MVLLRERASVWFCCLIKSFLVCKSEAPLNVGDQEQQQDKMAQQ